MSVPAASVAAYLVVVIIWSTTPLGIKFSTETVSPLLAVTLRMVVAAVLAWLTLLLIRKPLPLNRLAMLSYASGSIGVLGAMTLVYEASLFVPSGLISVLFGMSPIVAGLLAMPLLGERPFSGPRLIGIVIAVGGLVLIFGGNGDASAYGLTLLLGSVVLFALSSVLVKRLSAPLHPLAQTTGTLLMSSFGFVALCLLNGETVPENVSQRSAAAIAYLAICGSVVAFGAYYYILERLNVATVALIPIITPVLALMLGVVLADEVVGLKIVWGTSAILFGLMTYQWGGRLLGIMRGASS